MTLEDLADYQPGPPRILFIDFERTPGFVTRPIWEGKDAARWRYIHPREWDVLPSTLCFAAQHLGQKRAEFRAVWDDEKDEHYLARESWQMVNDCDILVTYYGTGADEKWMRGDWVRAGLPRPRPYKHVDMYRVATQFGFPSNSLDHLCQQLGLPGKRGHYSIPDAMAALEGDERKRREMRRYNIGDVGPNSLMGVFLRLRAWLPTSLNIGAFYPDGDPRCHACGSPDLAPDGWYTATTYRFGQYRCVDCGALNRNGYIKSRATMRGVT